MGLRRALAALVLTLVAAGDARAINIVIDYTYDSYGFFSPSSTNGQQARATVEAAASLLSDLLEDTFVAIETPPDYISTVGTAQPVTYSWNWQMQFTSPGSSSFITLSNPTVAEDEYRIYVGAKELGSDGGGNILGRGGPGGFSSSSGGSYYTAAQLAEIQAIGVEFSDALNNRGQGPGDFGRWGGTLTFDTTTNWNYDHTVLPASGQSDLYSVALHEIVHAAGFGTYSQNSVSEWQANLTPDQRSFNGPNATALYGGVVPLNPDADHFQEGLQSTVFGGTAMQETLMDPTITNSTRKVLTSLDAAAMRDLGWEITETIVEIGPGDFNGDGRVDNGDLNLLLGSWGSATAPPTWDWGFDTTVDNGELNALLGSWGAGVPAAVPEPAAWCVLATAAAVWRRR